MNRIKTFVTNTFIGGLVVILPVLIFWYLINWLVTFFGNLLEPIASLFPLVTNYPNTAKIIAFILVIAFCFSLGLFVRTNFGTDFLNWIEDFAFSKLPFYSTIKETVKQFVGTDNMPFSKVVMVKPYGGAAKMLGFVTARLEDGTYTIFVPTAPNPTSGFVIFVQEEDVEHLNVTVEEAMRTNIGLGRGADQVLKFKP